MSPRTSAHRRSGGRSPAARHAAAPCAQTAEQSCPTRQSVSSACSTEAFFASWPIRWYHAYRISCSLRDIPTRPPSLI
jgi:hypothetical protein